MRAPPSQSASLAVVATPPVVVGLDTVHLLRDGVAAHAAMLDAIRGAQREILLEMYWIGHDHVGRAFLEALVERARAGVKVCVIHDAVGSFGLPASFWTPLRAAGEAALLVDDEVLPVIAEMHARKTEAATPRRDGREPPLRAAGGTVRRFSPVSPWRRRFRFARVHHRDHRKNLTVDEERGFAGGINLGAEWAPLHGVPWRDDAIEVRGPATRTLRVAFYRVWTEIGEEAPAGATDLAPRESDARVHVLTNEITAHPNRAIRRTYLFGIRRARTSICVASAYFLPGPLFLFGLRRAAKRGVCVRILVPETPDVRIVKLAMSSLLGRLLEAGVEVYAYSGRMLHAKTAVFDDEIAMVGSHNLDALSWRFNLECNVIVQDAAFATQVRHSFDADCAGARRMTLEQWQHRSLWIRIGAWFVALFRTFL
jgi:cardiolipin synthase